MVIFLFVLLSSFSFLYAEPTLVLKSAVEGPSSLYPGQKTKLVYRYYYSGDIELVTEKLPLLDPQGLIKVGEKEFNDSSENGVNITAISQEVEAAVSGSFSFPPSLIEGYAYQKDENGKRVKIDKKLSSESPGITITVLPFPSQNKPASFNGAMGKEFSFKAALQGNSTLHVGDELALILTITGDSAIKKVPLPDVCCQPGFTGFFRVSDLPPVEVVNDHTKTATVRLSALNATIKEIPAIEFSFFNPMTLTYHVLRSQPIPITVLAAEGVAPAPVKRTEVPTSSSAPSPVNAIFHLTPGDASSLFLGSWWVLGLIPMGIGCLFYQVQMRAYFRELQRKRNMPTSKKVLEKALSYPPDSPLYFSELRRGLTMLLNERSDMADQISILFEKLDEKQFSKYKEIDNTDINRRVREVL